jgi:hypothetical protein
MRLGKILENRKTISKWHMVSDADRYIDHITPIQNTNNYWKQAYYLDCR